MFDLYYYHDPMCSWCWGYRDTARILFANLPQDLRLVRVLGGLAPDNDEPMPAPLRASLQATWKRIESTLGTEFNFDFWELCQPRRSTYPACRAVIAAANQEREVAIIEAIQRAYYLRAMNPSDTETLELLAVESGLDVARFAEDLRSAATELELQRQVDFARRSPINGFPSLAIGIGSELVPVVHDYRSHATTIAHIRSLTAPASSA